MMKPSTVRASAPAGKSRTLGWLLRASLAAAMSAPQETTEEGRPMPRKLKVASETMKTPSSTVAVTMMGAAALGMTWRSSMAMRPEPSAREAVT